MSLNYPNICHAMGSIRGTDGATTMAAGCSVARSAAGTYNISLDDDVDATQCVIVASPRGANSAVIRAAHTSDTVKQLVAFVLAGTTAQDTDIDFMIFRAPR